MLKIFEIKNTNKIEILPINKIYNVLELGKYEIQYFSGNTINEEEVFIEDIAIDRDKIIRHSNSIILSEFRYFEDYFGYASLNINNEVFLFNIKIEKLKLSEIEDIFTFLWEREDKLFNIFFSKSTYNLDFKKNGFELGQTSKLISFIETFIYSFEKLYYSFQSLPHTILRQQKSISKYEPNKVTSESANWIIANLDEVFLDSSLKGHIDAIQIENMFGLIDNIEISAYINSFDNYENQIILGSFKLILDKIKKLKNQISFNINIDSKNNHNYQLADFKDLKKIPFIKLFKDSLSLEKRIEKLYYKYQSLFRFTTPNIEKPKLTSVFSQKFHYRKAYELIRRIRNYNFDLSGEFKLLNISKLSKLYEVYNLYIIIDAIKSKLRMDLFKYESYSNRGDEIIENLYFYNNSYKISILYEHKYSSSPNNLTNLLRIDKGYYNPDFVVEIENKADSSKKYYIFDSKYSKINTIKANYLFDTIKKYILNTALQYESNKKINSLYLLTPSDYGENIVNSSFFDPKIAILPSKPQKENKVKEIICEIIENNLEENYYI